MLFHHVLREYRLVRLEDSVVPVMPDAQTVCILSSPRFFRKTLLQQMIKEFITFALFFSFLFFSYSRWTSSLPSCLWSQRIFPSLPGSRLTIFLSRCKFSTLTTRQPMVEFYLLTFPRFPLRKKEHKSYFGKNRTHDFRTSRCAAYLLDLQTI